MQTKRIFILLLSASALLLLPLLCSAQCRTLDSGYDVTEIGTLGGRSSEAFDINNSGVVVGTSTISTDPLTRYHGFVFKNGVITDPLPDSDVNGELRAVTDNGNFLRYRRGVVGSREPDFIEATEIIYPSGTVTPILLPENTCNPNIDRLQLSKLTDSGYSVGAVGGCGFSGSKPAMFAVNQFNNRINILSFLHSIGGVNEAGTLIGTILESNGGIGTQAVLVDLTKIPFRVSEVVPQIPNRTYSEGIDINNSGDYLVRGENSDFSGSVGAVFKKQGGVSIISLTGFTIYPHAFNNNAEVIGDIYQVPGGGGSPEPFVWKNDRPTHLKCLVSNDVLKKWKLVKAAAINDKGQIAVNAVTLEADPKQRKFQALLLTPKGARSPIVRPSGRILAQNKTQFSLSLTKKGKLTMKSKLSSSIDSCSMQISFAKTKDELLKKTETVKSLNFTQNKRILKFEKQTDINSIITGSAFYTVNPYCFEVDSGNKNEKRVVRKIRFTAPNTLPENANKTIDEMLIAEVGAMLAN